LGRSTADRVGVSACRQDVRVSDRDTAKVDYDAELRLLNAALQGAWEIDRDDRVLDVGCGTGQTTRDAARLAGDGWALGVDVSSESIDRARSLARAEGVGNVAFEAADAQDRAFGAASFDLATSRFGTMFFRDPVAAFANIGRALRPGGRLLMMVWQAHERNEWSVSIERALGARAGARIPTPPGLDAFSLADPATVRAILDASGFADVTLVDVRKPVFYGRDVAAALDWVGGFTSTSDALSRLDPSGREAALDRLTELFGEHADESGVWFDARAWIVRARRP
jgi:SAM-dependent methyltransferase